MGSAAGFAESGHRGGRDVDGVWGGVRCGEEEGQGSQGADQARGAGGQGLGGGEVGRADGRVEEKEVG